MRAKMCCNLQRANFLLDLFVFSGIVFCLSFVSSQCKHPVIFNFGDSNSDTGGYAAAMGIEYVYPYGRTFFRKPTSRMCDGRLVIDFLCENLNTSYLSPYLNSLEPDFTNGASFAIIGASILPKNFLYSLNVQILQFRRFQKRALELRYKGQEDFKNALYRFDIGQNDLMVAFQHLSYAKAIAKIPSLISEIRDAMWAIYLAGGKNFLVHNTGPLGCLPSELATTKTNATDYDEHGCIKSLNEGAKIFNTKLGALCQELRSQMINSTIVYVDNYSIKYELIVDSALYGFKNPLMACYGCGGGPYNFNPNGNNEYTVCEDGSKYISWDGLHYTEAANAIVASKILSTKYSTPPIKFDFFCNKHC